MPSRHGDGKTVGPAEESPVTIAACYLSPEGVIFGADSTTTFATPEGPRHYNYAQKIFQVGGLDSTLGVVIWGLGGLQDLSYRTLIAQFAEQNHHEPTASLRDVAERFAAAFWREYTARLAPLIAELRRLNALPTPTPDEIKTREALAQNLQGGFCVGGNLLHDRTPQAYTVSYHPLGMAATVTPIAMHSMLFGGVGNYINRLMLGIDPELFAAILRSGRWLGAPDDLSKLVDSYRLAPPGALPLREAIDWVHSSIYATIKALKFSRLSPVCGGPVEIAVITTDRPFRWVRHKKMDAAVSYGGPLDA
jgi:hypothetical protein